MLGGRTVAEWKDAMTADEFDAWGDFYHLHPFDDLHRYHRPAALIASSMNGGSIEGHLAWLEPEPQQETGFSAADLKSMSAFGIKPKQKE